MHEHIRKNVEDILNLVSESISLYKSTKKESLSEVGAAALNSIIQSKENSLNALLKQFNKIYPDFKVKTYTAASETLQTLYSRLISIEKTIMNSVDNNLLPNIPSKGHEGIYTIAMNIKSNSESSIAKLNSILGIRTASIYSNDLYYYLIHTSLDLLDLLETFEKAGLNFQAKMCTEILKENKNLFLKNFNKNLIIYTPANGDSYLSISSKFKMELSTLLKLNSIVNPYESTLPRHLLIIS